MDGQGYAVVIERIPIQPIDDFLLVSIQVEMHDALAETLMNDVTHAVAERGSIGVLIDISALDVVDSFIGRVLQMIANTTQMMGAQTVIVGMQPAVAITLVELGLTFEGIRTALNAGRGMAILRRDHG